MTRIINLYGAPGAGKSSIAAGLFYYLKKKGISCELVNEFAKELVWDNSQNVLDDQIFVFAHQNHRLLRLLDKVDYVITDSPILLSKVYNNYSSELDHLIDSTYETYTNVDILVQRTKNYVQSGRTQSEEESDEIGKKIRSMLEHECFLDNSLIYVDSDVKPKKLWKIIQEN